MQLAGKSKVSILWAAVVVIALGALAYAATPAQKFAAGKKAKVSGVIVSRDGDLVNINVKKTGTLAVISISDNTKIERKKDFGARKKEMDVTAMVPGLTIDVEGVGNASGQLDAAKVTFDPDVFAVEVAEEKQIEANKAAAAQAQSTANQGVAAAGQAQSSADAAQSTANDAGAAALAAGTVAVVDAAAIKAVNQRVSDLGDYKTVVEAALFFDSDSSKLSDADKQVLDKLASDAKAVDKYLIEITGYASSTGTKALNQKLSDERAQVVADYLRNSASVPARRLLLPAGYGATHPAASNTDSEGRAVNRRVDVKVLVNKGLAE